MQPPKVQPAELEKGKKTPKTDFGVKKWYRQKIWVQPEPKFKKKKVEFNRLNPNLQGQLNSSTEY